MFRLILFAVLILNICGSEDDLDSRIVDLEEGAVKGNIFWGGDFYEFYGIPYATAPKGRDRFKAPLPVTKRDGILEATANTICPQVFYTGEEEEEIIMSGEEDCLLLNILVPKVANEDNLLPVVVYIHSGAFAGGSGNMGKLNYLARHEVLAVSFNYRVGAIGFACLHTEEIPGNAALKDALAALKWINKNIKKFGGDPNKVTLAGFSVGAAMAELMALSKHTEGLFDKLILESGSALAPFAINLDPVETARNIAFSMGYNETYIYHINDLTEFYLNATKDYTNLAAKSLNFFLPNATFGFSPCIEVIENNPEPFLTESPIELFKRKEVRPLAILTGFSNMEGLSRSAKYQEWRKMMQKDFTDFLPADLFFLDDEERYKVAEKIKEFYFKGKEINRENLQDYVDFFSDSMFKYSILKSAKLHGSISSRPIYLYEFSYVGQLNVQHFFLDSIKGASHRDQTAYIWDFHGHTNSFKDFDARDRMTWMWTDFIKYENPTAYESPLINVNWKKYSIDKPYYLSIGKRLELKKNILSEAFRFWDNIYEKYYYWHPLLESLTDLDLEDIGN